MEFLEIIARRRSIRAYETYDVSDQLVLKVIECGHQAPTAGNLQPWEFVVVRDEAQKHRIADATFRGNNPDSDLHQDWIATAPVLVIVAGNRGKCVSRYGDKGRKTLIYLDCSACIENMLLASVNFGLGSCYISGFHEEKLGEVLGLPAEYEAIGIVPLGYPRGETAIKSKDDIASHIHYERFANNGLD